MHFREEERVSGRRRVFPLYRVLLFLLLSACGHHSAPDPDSLFREATLLRQRGETQQALERDRKKREAILHKIQQKLYDEARFIPVWELGFLCASGPRAAVSGLSLIPLYAYSGPYEDVQLKS